eukprot:1790102-Rhodomonas_salina.13
MSGLHACMRPAQLHNSQEQPETATSACPQQVVPLPVLPLRQLVGRPATSGSTIPLHQYLHWYEDTRRRIADLPVTCRPSGNSCTSLVVECGTTRCVSSAHRLANT